MCCIQSFFAETAVNFIQELKLNLKKFIKYTFLEHLKQKYKFQNPPTSGIPVTWYVDNNIYTRISQFCVLLFN